MYLYQKLKSPPSPGPISLSFVFICWQAEDRLHTTSLSIPTLRGNLLPVLLRAIFRMREIFC